KAFRTGGDRTVLAWSRSTGNPGVPGGLRIHLSLGRMAVVEGPEGNVVPPPVFGFARRDVDPERLERGDLEFEAAVGAREDLPLDEAGPLDRAAALRALRHADPPWRRRSTRSTHSARLESESRSRLAARSARASCTRPAAGERPPRR